MVGKHVADDGQFGPGIELLLALLPVARHALARVTRRRVAPRLVLACLWDQRERKRLGADGQYPVGANGSGPASALADRGADVLVHLLDVAVVHVGDLGGQAKALANLGEHRLLVLPALGGELRADRAGGLGHQVLGDVAVEQVLDGGRLPALALLAGRIAARVDLPAQLLGALRAAATDHSG
jgi:hypothetical protein